MSPNVILKDKSRSGKHYQERHEFNTQKVFWMLNIIQVTKEHHSVWEKG